MMPDPLSEAFPRAARELQALQQSIQPEAGFAQRLEERLTERPAQVLLGQHTPARPRFALPRLNLRQPAWVVMFAILTILLAALLAIGPQKVLAAVRGIIGYIPEIGFVDHAETAQEIGTVVRVEREGVTVTILQAVADTSSTRINLQADGFRTPQQPYLWPEPKDPYLQLADGEALPLMSGTTSGTASTGTITAQYAFAPLPAGVDQATLVLPGLPGLAPGQAPENWQIPLLFEPIPAGVIGNPPTVGPWQSEPQQGMTLVLDRVAQTADETVLQVHIAAANPRTQTASDWWNHLILTDASGRSYPLADEPTADSVTTDIHLLKTGPLPGDKKFILRLDRLDLVTGFPRDTSAPGFSFDPGSDARVGQVWKLNETISVGNLSLQVTGATLSAENEPNTVPAGRDVSHYGLRFTFAAQEGVSQVQLRCEIPSPCGGVASVSNGEAIFTNILGLAELPKQPMVIRVEDVWTTTLGPWEVHWEAMALQK